MVINFFPCEKKFNSLTKFFKFKKQKKKKPKFLFHTCWLAFFKISFSWTHLNFSETIKFSTKILWNFTPRASSAWKKLFFSNASVGSAIGRQDYANQSANLTASHLGQWMSAHRSYFFSPTRATRKNDLKTRTPDVCWASYLLFAQNKLHPAILISHLRQVISSLRDQSPSIFINKNILNWRCLFKTTITLNKWYFFSPGVPDNGHPKIT